MGKKLTTEEFIQKAKQTHGDKYDYSLVNYKGNKNKVKIICPEHGDFSQRADHHVNGANCKMCSYTKLIANNFIEKAKAIHGDKYDYSLVDYINNITKIKIICQKHGVFEQYPCNHLQGKGCISCSGTSKLTKEIFVRRAKQTHGDKYDYSLVKYKNNYTKVKIICQKHGVFEQQPIHHLNGNNCPICNESKGELRIARILDENNIKYKRQYRLDDCKNIKPLPFDFYILDKNVLIEFDGEQHYKPVNFFGGVEGFKQRQKNDDIKTKYCKDNNIKLIRIKHSDNIENRLKELI